jgi:sulfoxide reductase heme-binding subunit YedZ
MEWIMRKPTPDFPLKTSVWILGLSPLGWGAWSFFSDGLGANPVEALMHLAGRWALAFLLLGLAVSPIRRFTGWGRVIKVRRLLGLFAFFYAATHLLVYLGLDQGFAWSFILEDVVERPFITVGFTAFLLLLPLAGTSTRGWIRRLGRRWRLLHRLVYPAAGLAALHFYWKVKADTSWPLLVAGLLAVLLFARLPWGGFRKKSGARKRGGLRRDGSAPEREAGRSPLGTVGRLLEG